MEVKYGTGVKSIILRGGCGVSRLDSESNESIYKERFVTGTCANGVKCRVVGGLRGTF